MEKLHVLAIGVHPDDIELGCTGTLINHIKKGEKVGILDLTQGELGSRGTIETRYKEAADAAKVMGVTIRENLKLRDGFFRNDEENQLKIIQVLRKYQPDIVLANALEDRHPDHGRAGHLIADACFLSGLIKIETMWNGEKQTAWRPKRVFHYIQDRFFEPDIIVDISDSFEQKMEAIKCYTTQFSMEDTSDSTLTYISQPGFLEKISARSALMGQRIGVAHGEGFTCKYDIGVSDLNQLVYPKLA